MKKQMFIGVLMAGLIGLGVVCLAQAGTYRQELLTTLNAETNATGTEVSGRVKGQIDDITIILPIGVTGDVSVVASDNYSLFAKDGNTGGTNIYAVLVPTHTTAGAVIVSNLAPAVIVGTVTANFNDFNVTGQTATVKIKYHN